MKFSFVFLLILKISLISSSNIKNDTENSSKIKYRSNGLLQDYLQISLNILRNLNLFTSWSNFTYYPIGNEIIDVPLDFIVEQNWFDEQRSIREDGFFLKGTDLSLKRIGYPQRGQFFLEEKVLRNFNAKLISVNRFGGRRYKYELFIFSLMFHDKTTIYSPYTVSYTLKNDYFNINSLLDFQKFFCNEPPKISIDGYNVLYSGSLLEFHSVKHTKGSFLTYDEIIDKRKNLILDSYEYYKYVGRLPEVQSSMFIFFLRVLDEKTGIYTYPFRIFNQRYAKQETIYVKLNIFDIEKAFQLDKNDVGYIKMFNQIEGETSSPNFVYASTSLLESLKIIFKNKKLDDFFDEKLSSEKIDYKNIYQRMIRKNDGVYGRVIFGNILTDFTPLTRPRRAIYTQFNSDLILNWFCLGYDGQSEYIDRSVLFPCKFEYRQVIQGEFELDTIDLLSTIPNVFEKIDPITWPQKEFETKATVKYTYKSAEMQLKKVFYPKSLFIESSAKKLFTNKFLILFLSFFIFLCLIN